MYGQNWEKRFSSVVNLFRKRHGWFTLRIIAITRDWCGVAIHLLRRWLYQRWASFVLYLLITRLIAVRNLQEMVGGAHPTSIRLWKPIFLSSNTFTNGFRRSYALESPVSQTGYQSSESHNRESCLCPPMNKTCITRTMLSSGFTNTKKISVFECLNQSYCSIMCYLLRELFRQG